MRAPDVCVDVCRKNDSCFPRQKVTWREVSEFGRLGWELSLQHPSRGLGPLFELLEHCIIRLDVDAQAEEWRSCSLWFVNGITQTLRDVNDDVTREERRS